ADHAHDPIGADRPAPGEGDVEQPEDVTLGQPPHPRLELVELAGGQQCSHDRAHRGAGDADHLVAAGLELADRPDVCVPARPAGTERQRHPHATTPFESSQSGSTRAPGPRDRGPRDRPIRRIRAALRKMRGHTGIAWPRGHRGRSLSYPRSTLWTGSSTCSIANETHTREP